MPEAKQPDHVRVGDGEIVCQHCEKREPMAATPTKATEILATLKRFNAEHQHCEPKLRELIERVKSAAAAADRAPHSDGLGELIVKKSELAAVIAMADQFVTIDEQGQWLCGLMWDAEVSRLDAARFTACASCGRKHIPRAELLEHIENCEQHPLALWKARATMALAAIGSIERYVLELAPNLKSRAEFAYAFNLLKESKR